MITLREAKLSIDNMIEPARKRRAMKWRDKAATKEGQIQILKAARNKDDSAIDYLFLDSASQIMKAFMNYVGPNSDIRRQRISGGDFEDFIAESYMLLVNGYEREDGTIKLRSPLETFDYSIYKGDVDLINKFKYYYLQYMKALGKSMNNRNRKEGITGRELDGKIKTYSLDAESDTDPDSHEGSSTYGEKLLNKYGKLGVDTDMDDSLEDESFMKKWRELCKDPALDKKDGLFRRIIKAIVKSNESTSVNAAIESAGIELKNKNTFYRYAREVLPEMLSDYGISSSEFTSQITKGNGDKLARVLR